MEDAAAIIHILYRNLLNRGPQPEELNYWVSSLTDNGLSFVLQEFFSAPERTSKVGAHPPGHFYSPLNDASNLDYEKMARDRLTVTSIPGVDINRRHQAMTWKVIVNELMTRKASPIKPRYSLPNGTYGEGDSLIQKGMMLSLQPRTIIEIGSGYSSASMMDCAEEYGLSTEFIFIEPYPDTLLGLLREGDNPNIIKSGVQDVRLEIFETLEANDILFVDSSHVMKSQSDVNFEIFDILPRLRPGVVVHFHDVFWPFEYPIDWIKNRGYTWNELYGLRAFLMSNSQYEIIFWNDAFSVLEAEEVERAPDPVKVPFNTNPGGGLWLRKRY